MNPKVNKTALVDTGFWFAIFNKKDPYYQEAQTKVELLMEIKYVIPWPVLYETLRSCFIGKQNWIKGLDELLQRPNAERLDDSQYREQALDNTLKLKKRIGKGFSLCDNIIRLIIEDRNVRLNYLFTFDSHFNDVCTKRQIEII